MDHGDQFKKINVILLFTFIALFVSSCATSRFAPPRKIVDLQFSRDIEKLIVLLKNKNPKNRMHASKALGDLKGYSESAIAHLKNSINDKDERVSLWSYYALANIAANNVDEYVTAISNVFSKEFSIRENAINLVIKKYLESYYDEKIVLGGRGVNFSIPIELSLEEGRIEVNIKKSNIYNVNIKNNKRIQYCKIEFNILLSVGHYSKKIQYNPFIKHESNKIVTAEEWAEMLEKLEHDEHDIVLQQLEFLVKNLFLVNDFNLCPLIEDSLEATAISPSPSFLVIKSTFYI